MRPKHWFVCIVALGTFASMLVTLGGCHSRPADFVTRATHK